MGMKINMDVAKFKEQLRATADELGRATRPAAQSFIARSIKETRSEVRAAIKARFIEEVNGK